MTRSASKVKGLFTALLTPFDDNGNVDADRLAKLVRFQVSKGTEGIFPCGSTGLGPMLSLEERKTVAETVIESCRRKVPVVVQVGAPDTPSTVELARHAAGAGAYAVATLTPYYYKPGERAVAKHFEAVADAVDVPVLAYNIPQFTGNSLQAKAVADLAKAGTLSGIKDSSRDFLHLLDLIDAVPDAFAVMNGTEEYGLFAINSGADGLVSGGANALPELFKSMLAADRRGDHAAALSAQRQVQAFKDLVKQGQISAYYEILRERGVDCGLPRRPLLPLEKTEGKRVIDGLRGLDLI
ncbi:MAG: dihydrodipicolinate synthase family protein [Nitrososphaerota archaeon]|jgi:4-hydroxy-tetrahydrodipicolinate synthase|nr:dihydrodipicolinate synthase family protein [Nitrososphaerota archaeon]MDG6953032.1 dihydrodipicolinate synthase family protein [Nitrososphaerota archaeon]MDG6956976.1 dihydrodipicolinate synthase family protein [Nitrososphaerota archaeon]MDG6959329.1 dihydrodipicolinate synthase family protein [Nitrososphaerota archaeon]MDG6969178.1 dihydrodipicolinate synthase family protein [Nitrososphaerota archaeon]